MYWLITRAEDGAPARLATGPGEETLPVFGFEEEAGMFLKFGMPDGDEHRLRTATSEELLSILTGPREFLRWVVLDPLPGVFSRVSPSRIGREKFVFFLMSDRVRDQLAGGHKRGA
jgi:hypothetical protein